MTQPVIKAAGNAAGAAQDAEGFEAFAASPAPAGILVPLWLDLYARQIPHSRADAVLRRAASLTRQSRRFAAAAVMQPEARAALSHLASVGAASMQLCAAALTHDGRGLGDDRAVDAAFQSLQRLVFADGVIDVGEQVVLHSAVRVVSFEPPPAEVTSLLWALAAGVRLPSSGMESLTLQEDILGPTALTLQRNRGVLRIVKPGYPPAGYRWIAPSDPLRAGRNASKECFTFALSTGPGWELPEHVLPDQLLRDRYRSIDLAAEKAQAGDLVAYYPLIWSTAPQKSGVIAGEIQHLAIVTAIDAQGRPTRAVSKVGPRMGVFEHPVDEASLSVGVVWAVFRKR